MMMPTSSQCSGLPLQPERHKQTTPSPPLTSQQTTQSAASSTHQHLSCGKWDTGHQSHDSCHSENRVDPLTPAISRQRHQNYLVKKLFTITQKTTTKLKELEIDGVKIPIWLIYFLAAFMTSIRLLPNRTETWVFGIIYTSLLKYFNKYPILKPLFIYFPQRF